ncbi:MAG TPA: TetR/AcrR family transcriptional regulator [Casimicrobiaceae bacterium]|nr:TetR/AcrR family transcriptional regulator [Casimicrobiaceae bacterium]
MARKPPRRTRERILATSLSLFNAAGEPHVTTADIADEMNISPGNLYYHFRNKDEIIGELFGHFDDAVRPLLGGPSSGAANVEDLWLFVHVLFERMWEYRFFFRDLDEITSRDAKLAARFAALIGREQSAVIELCRGLRAAEALIATDDEIEAVAMNAVMLTTYWMSFQRLSSDTGGMRSMPRAAALRSVVMQPASQMRRGSVAPDMKFERGVSQVLALLVPYLHGVHRVLAERLRAPYLEHVS